MINGNTLTPDAVHDFRDKTVRQVHYPADAVLVVAGIPGAGKSTLLERLFPEQGGASFGSGPGPDSVELLDSHHDRIRWRRWLGRLPYPLWRPIVHLAYYARIRTAIATAPGPIIVHECGTRRLTRELIRRWASRRRRALHLLLLDVHPTVALQGQRTRRRLIRTRSFTAHCRRWKRLITGVDGERLPAGVASVVIMGRSAADELRRVKFDPPTTPAGQRSWPGFAIRHSGGKVGRE